MKMRKMTEKRSCTEARRRQGDTGDKETRRQGDKETRRQGEGTRRGIATSYHLFTLPPFFVLLTFRFFACCANLQALMQQADGARRRTFGAHWIGHNGLSYPCYQCHPWLWLRLGRARCFVVCSSPCHLVSLSPCLLVSLFLVSSPCLLVSLSLSPKNWFLLSSSRIELTTVVPYPKSDVVLPSKLHALLVVL